MAKKIRLKREVEEILKNYPESRNSDITLMILIWTIHYSAWIKKGQTGQLGIWLNDLYKLPTQDNIKRIRAKFQNELNLYLPTIKEVVKQRRINEEKWREYMKKFSDPVQERLL